MNKLVWLNGKIWGEDLRRFFCQTNIKQVRQASSVWVPFWLACSWFIRSIYMYSLSNYTDEYLMCVVVLGIGLFSKIVHFTWIQSDNQVFFTRTETVTCGMSTWLEFTKQRVCVLRMYVCVRLLRYLGLEMPCVCLYYVYTLTTCTIYIHMLCSTA